MRKIDNQFLWSIILGVSVFLFWGMLYSAHLNFLEQMQMFTYDWACFCSHLDHPGGIGEYIGEFITQFYFNPWIGALLIAVLIVMVQQLSRLLIQCSGLKGKKVVWCSMLPALFLWCYLLDKHAFTSFGVSLVITLCAAYGLTYISSIKWSVFFAVMMSSLLYYIIGPLHFLFVLYVMVYERRNKVIFSSVALWAFIIPICSYMCLSYPLSRLYTGIGYYRIVDSTSDFTWNMQDEEVLTYDKMVRFKQWSAIIEKAQQKTPTNAASMQCVNLALSMKGQLVERLMDFPQTGVECLISEVTEQMTSPYPVGEIHYQLGLINTAERLVFDIQQLQPMPSVRTWIRMAETNIVNGQYAVAEKYLNKILKTHFYRKWAEKMKLYLNNEKEIQSNTEIVSLRYRRLKNDVYYSAKEIDNMLGRLVMENDNNYQAYDYLISFLLLKCDLDKLVRLFPNNTEHALPRVVQEALTFAWMQQNPNFDEIPWKIDPKILQSAVSFARQSTVAGTTPTEDIKTQFGHTYWYYYIYTSNKK